MALGNYYLAALPTSASGGPIKKCAGLLVGLFLAGCSQSYDETWSLGFGVPDYMEVWIETADVVDIRERVFRRAGSGIASVLTPKDNKGKPAGWPKSPGRGAGRDVIGAELPRLIYVRWQSLAEPQTYEAYIVIPELAREIMRKPEKAFCRADGKWITDYRDDIGVGLAPTESIGRFQKSPKPTSISSAFPMAVGKECQHFRCLNTTRQCLFKTPQGYVLQATTPCAVAYGCARIRRLVRFRAGR